MKLFRKVFVATVSLFVFCNTSSYSATEEIPWDRNEIENHTMKLKSTNTTKESFVFHDNGIAIIPWGGDMEPLQSLRMTWHIDSSGTLVLKTRSSQGEISLKKISSKGDTVDVLRNGQFNVYTRTKHPPTIPWGKNEIENQKMELPPPSKSNTPQLLEKVESYFFREDTRDIVRDNMPPATNARVHLGTKNAIAPLLMWWKVDSSGTLVVTDYIGHDIIMKKISSKGDTVEVLRNGVPVIYKKMRYINQWSDYVMLCVM